MKTPEELKNNPWADAHKYADNKYHMEKGDHMSKYERYEEVKEAFEAGYTQCQEDMADKKYTEEDLHNLLRARRQLYSHTDENVLKVFINSINKQDNEK